MNQESAPNDPKTREETGSSEPRATTTSKPLSKSAQERARRQAVRLEHGHEIDRSWADAPAGSTLSLQSLPRQLQKFLRKKQVLEATSLSNSELYALIAEGRFPKPFKLTGTRVNTDRLGVVVWVEAEVALWQAQRVASRKA